MIAIDYKTAAPAVLSRLLRMPQGCGASLLLRQQGNRAARSVEVQMPAVQREDEMLRVSDLLLDKPAQSPGEHRQGVGCQSIECSIRVQVADLSSAGVHSYTRDPLGTRHTRKTRERERQQRRMSGADIHKTRVKLDRAVAGA